MRQLALLCLLCLPIISGCQNAGQPAAANPTAAPKLQPEANLEAAAAIANRFLEAWQQTDYAAMYELLTFRNRELTAFAEFRALYQQAHATISLESLSFQPHSLSGEGRVLDFKYDVAFKSRILGKFSDSDRLLQLVIDTQAADWRIAWSPADIFAELGAGARLVLEEQAPSRANIYDRYGKVLADQNGRVVRVLVDNRHITDRDTCFHSLASASGKSVEFFRDLFDVRSGPDWIVDAGILEATDYIENQRPPQSGLRRGIPPKVGSPLSQWDAAAPCHRQRRLPRCGANPRTRSHRLQRGNHHRQSRYRSQHEPHLGRENPAGASPWSARTGARFAS